MKSVTVYRIALTILYNMSRIYIPVLCPKV